MRNYRRSLGLLLGILLLGGDLHSAYVRAQQLHSDPVVLEILKIQNSFRQFDQERAEHQRSRDRERMSIPAYNIELSHVVAAFHRHIQDMHHRHVDCKLCRQYTTRIKQLAKRIDSGMK